MILQNFQYTKLRCDMKENYSKESINNLEERMLSQVEPSTEEDKKVNRERLKKIQDYSKTLNNNQIEVAI